MSDYTAGLIVIAVLIFFCYIINSYKEFLQSDNSYPKPQGFTSNYSISPFENTNAEYLLSRAMIYVPKDSPLQEQYRKFLEITSYVFPDNS